MRCLLLSACATAALLFAACLGFPRASTGPSPSPVPASHSAPAEEVQPVLPAWRCPVETRKDDVVDTYHGEQVADPYRWLEDQDGAEVAQWVAAQNQVSRAFLDAVPERAEIRARLEELWNYPRYGGLGKVGGRWFYSKNDGLQNQAVVWSTPDPEQDGSVLLDPNLLSAAGTVAIAGFEPDEQGEKVAYAVAERGSDWKEWRVREVATGNDLPDVLKWCKFSSAAWTHDGKGFFYQRYPAPEEGEVYEAQNRKPQLCYHVLGTGQQDDRIVYERPDQPDWGFGGRVTEDGRFLVVNVKAGTDEKNRIACVDLQEAGWPVRPLLMAGDASYHFLANDGDRFYFRTTKDAPRGRIVAIDRTAPDPEGWQVLVPEANDALEAAAVVAERFVCLYLHDACHVLRRFQLDGSADGEIPLPGLGSVAGLTGRRKDAEAAFAFTSFLYPTTVFRYHFAERTLKPFHPPVLPFDPSPYVVERLFPQSRDGTRLCLFVVRRKDARLEGGNPTYLYGYGGFNIAMTPGFSVARLVWLERGGIYAQAVLRGGSEYGQAWHEAGMLGRKQNVFDDFVACAEYLQRNGYTSRARLGIGGASNGGLLVGACLVQRPELFGAAVPQVGVLDLLRYHKFTIGWAWAGEYGRSDAPEQYQWLKAWSPLHNVKAGTAYPPTMVLTGDHDDRVLPGHSFKFAAALQAAQGGPGPILARIETDAGHGAGKPTGKQIDEATDLWTFLTAVLRG